MDHAAKERKKAEADKEKRGRKETREKLQSMEGIPKLLKRAQDAFNAFIRARDRHKGCFVCGEPFPIGQIGGDFDAGHVRSRGAAGHLRFDEDNCHGECKHCNSPTGAKPHQIKAGAIRRIGAARFERLENDNTPHKWEREELRQIADTYRAKARALKLADKR
jgi:hypothetical protein